MFANLTNVLSTLVFLSSAFVAMGWTINSIDQNVMRGRKELVDTLYVQAFRTLILVGTAALLAFQWKVALVALIVCGTLALSPSFYVLITGKWRGLTLSDKIPQMHAVADYCINDCSDLGEYLITTQQLSHWMEVFKVRDEHRLAMHKILHKYFTSVGYIVSSSTSIAVNLKAKTSAWKQTKVYTYCVDRKHVATTPPLRLQEYSGW